MKVNPLFLFAIMAVVATTGVAFGDAVVFTGAGSDADVTATLNAFRTALGPLNPNTPQSFGSGRREINWDGVPDSVAAPNLFPSGFFNVPVTGQARGVFLRTLGFGFQVSADNDNPTGTPPNFQNLNPQYGSLFRPFSGQRLFTALGQTSLVEFFVPGSDVPATVSGFGVVFSDVDLPETTGLFFFNEHNEQIASVFAPVAAAPDGGFSFAGIIFNEGERVARVGILTGNGAVDGVQTEGPVAGGFRDLVVIDDFVYGEPIPVTNRCLGDVNGNNTVGLDDLTSLLASFGTCTGDAGFEPLAELNDNGCVDLADLTILLAKFGTTCP